MRNVAGWVQEIGGQNWRLVTGNWQLVLCGRGRFSAASLEPLPRLSPLARREPGAPTGLKNGWHKIDIIMVF